MVALKRLDDAIRDGDNIRAVIRNSGANSDGRTTGIMLPSQAAQGRLAQSLFRNLSFTPLDVQYAEAHGTGTKAGDEVEIGAIRDVFCHDHRSGNPIFVGATKPNIGHSEAASGVAGLIKTVMAMEKGMIPPNILLENFKPGLKPDEQTLKVSLPRELLSLFDLHPMLIMILRTGLKVINTMAVHGLQPKSCSEQLWLRGNKRHGCPRIC